MNTLNKPILVSSKQNQEIARLAKASEIYKQGKCHKINDDSFLVEGTKDNYIVDIIDRDNEVYFCSCPDFEYRTDIQYCKHILSVQFMEINL